MSKSVCYLGLGGDGFDVKGSRKPDMQARIKIEEKRKILTIFFKSVVSHDTSFAVTSVKQLNK